MTGGVRTPPSKGSAYGRTILAEQGIAQRVISSEVKTGSVLINSYTGDDDNEGNEGVIYIGFDEDVDDESGFPLEPGQSIGLDIQNRSQGIWAYAEVPGDQVRFIATN